jgi:hypothetical protein
VVDNACSQPRHKHAPGSDNADVRVGERTRHVTTQLLPAAAARLRGASGLRGFLIAFDRPAGGGDPIATARLLTRVNAGGRAPPWSTAALGQVDRRGPAS